MMRVLIRVVEWAWLIVAVLCLFELIRNSFSGPNTLLYSIMLVVSIFMFFFRRKYRKRLEERLKDKK